MNKWILVRAGVWMLVLYWVVHVMQTPAVHNELTLPKVTPTGADPGQVIVALTAVAAARCAEGTLHVVVDAQGITKAWVVPGQADTSCLETAIAGQAWPALTTPMEMEWPLGAGGA